MRTSWAVTVVLGMGIACIAADAPVLPFESAATLTPQGSVDKFVFSALRQHRIPPARVCSDGVFVRRVYLDVIGTLPTPQEATQFLLDRSPRKRRDLVDQLLQRDEFGVYWSLKLADLLRVKAEFPINLWPNAVQAYHRWIRTSLVENMPYDRLARELLTASGSNFREPQVNFYRAVQSKDPETIARTVALTFLGERAENWPKERLSGMAVFFSQVGYKSTKEWKEEIVYFDPLKKPTQATAVFPDGTSVQLSSDKDPRELFADWLISPKNPWFARNIVNRIWCWLWGRGIIHEPDDVRPDNPPRIPELLASLERELITSQYDLKHVFRLILNSKSYQLSSIPRSEDPDAEAYFSYYPVRRVEAEVLIDAVCQITGTTEEYSSPIPEPFTFIPEHQRSIALADGSITSSFLELFGRPPRDTGLESERNNRMTAAQRLHLLNSTHIQRKIETSEKLRALTRSSRNPQESVAKIYLSVLSRFPTETELNTVQAYTKSQKTLSQENVIDLTWALMNSMEFLYRH
jgi:hypothetical protein